MWKEVPRERITTKLMKNTNSQKIQFNFNLFVFAFQNRF